MILWLTDGHPANRTVERIIREKTRITESKREDRTTPADRADVKDRDEARLRVSSSASGTHLDRSSSCRPSESDVEAESFPACLGSRTGGPVLEGSPASTMWMKSKKPARGQIESDVVADVRVPIVGDRRARRRGRRRKGSLETRAEVKPVR